MTTTHRKASGMKKESDDFIRGARWAMRRLNSKLPFMGNGCNCSADAVYYLEEMDTILMRNKYKKSKKERP